MLSVHVKRQRTGFALDVAFEQTTRALGIFGPSGAGKSTLLHLIAGLLDPDSGRIALDGKSLFDDASRFSLPGHQRRIGLMFQDDRLFPHLSVERNLRYGEKFVPRSERRFDFRSVVGALKLGRLLDRSVHHLSGGERQRIALGRALLCSPRLLMFDEPLSSLDLNLKLEIMPFLREAQEQFPIPMLYVSHDLSELLQLTDELVVLREGRVIDQGRYLTIARNTQVIDAIHHEGLMNVFSAAVADHDERAGISYLSLSPADGAALGGDSIVQTLAVPLLRANKGQIVQAVIRPEDISLARSRIEGISIQNQLRGKVVGCTAHGGRAVAEIEAGPRLLAMVSLRTAESMELSAGREIWCLIKSSAIQIR
jgi:molybdate transport system ATP-binding protein